MLADCWPKHYEPDNEPSTALRSDVSREGEGGRVKSSIWSRCIAGVTTVFEHSVASGHARALLQPTDPTNTEQFVLREPEVFPPENERFVGAWLAGAAGG